MLTVLESVQLSTDYLAKKGIDSPRINAELLLADILRCKRLDLYLKFDQPLQEEETQKYREYIKRRAGFEPLQYIVGWTEFYGMKFRVNKNVLIPRPETEILIETILKMIDKSNRYRILDIGTGSGNIPIVLAKNLIDSEIISIDISEEALKVADANAIENQVQNIAFIKKNIFDEDITRLFMDFDIVVSNPPYVSAHEYPSLQKEIKEHEPGYAVTDFEDGYKYYKRISSILKSLLKKNGKVFFEIGLGQSDKVKKLMEDNRLVNINVQKDLLKVDRVIYGEQQ